jgi:hypothetical protein
MFTVIAGCFYEFVQDLPPLGPFCRSVSFSNRVLQLTPGCHAQLPRHFLHHPAAPLLGSSLREATGIARVTKIVSQCADRRQLFWPVIARVDCSLICFFRRVTSVSFYAASGGAVSSSSRGATALFGLGAPALAGSVARYVEFQNHRVMDETIDGFPSGPFLSSAIPAAAIQASR